MDRRGPAENPAERQLFDTIKSTYTFAERPEQHAMIVQLRSGLPTIASQERMQLIDAIENAVGRGVEDEDEF